MKGEYGGDRLVHIAAVFSFMASWLSFPLTLINSAAPVSIFATAVFVSSQMLTGTDLST
jgi:hypothetical protein